MGKKQILVVTVSPIFPVNSGGKKYIANLTLPLAGEYDFHLIACGTPEDEEINKKYEQEYQKYFKSYCFVTNLRQPQNMNNFGRVKHYLFHILKGMPLMDCSFYTKEAVQAARKIVKEYDIDLLETHNLHTCFIRKEFPEIPALLCSQNIEGNLFPFWVHKRKQKWKNWIIESIAKISRKNTYEIEIKNKWKYNAMSFISQEDMDMVDDSANCEKVFLPMPFTIKPYVPPRKRDKLHLFWLGGFDWHPNLEGMEWFIDKILPLFTESDWELLELHIVGKKPTDKILSVHDGKRIFVHGWVDSIEQVMEQMDLLIVPILSGSGTRIKIIESICHGKAVLSTTKGAQGAGLTDGLNIVIRDEPSEFYQAIMELVKDWDQVERISKEAYQFAAENHDLLKVTEKKKEIYARIASRRIKGNRKGI